ncbi:MAG: SRPBCC domain-containing protein [Pseudoclavibacter sp.]
MTSDTNNRIQDSAATGGEAVARRITIAAAGGEAMGPTVSVELSRDFAAPATELWDSLTQPERLGGWFAPVKGDLRRGGQFQVEGNAGGTVEACEPLESFTVTWEFDGGFSLVSITLAEAGAVGDADGETGSAAVTRLTLEHEGTIPADFWHEYGPGATGVGWDLALVGLQQYIAAGPDASPATSEWAASDAGLAFVTESSRAWGDASIAGGTPEADARAAQERTTAFYTGAAE